jgi:hydroxymethylglutaryl-CoA reductase (NADPH)
VGGITSWSLVERVSRVPAFKFNNLIEIGKFTIWVSNQFEKFKEITKNNSNHAELEDIMINISGNIVFISLDFNTKDAAGQNMTTIITDNICRFILENSQSNPFLILLRAIYQGIRKLLICHICS